MNKQLENKLSSREVAEMMEMDHSKLLRKIDGINSDFNQTKIGFVKYWTEGTYIDTKGEERREFQITKRGCEFLAHKTTGTKGNLFTDRYMDRFEQMKEVITNNLSVGKEIPEREMVLNLIPTLADDEYRNLAIARIVEFVSLGDNRIKRTLPAKVSLSEEEFRNIVNDFITIDGAAIKEVENGLVIDKEKLYKHFSTYGLTRSDVLNSLHEYGMIYSTGRDKTQRIRLDGKITRVLILKE